MIIDKNIDKSLLLILNADEKNRDKIIEFINSIPDELKLLMRDRFKLYEEYKKNGEKKLTFLFGECTTPDNLLYFFSIDTYFNEIELGYMKSNGEVYEDEFRMSLLLDEELFSIRNFEKKYLGRIEYDIYLENVDDIYNKRYFCENTYNLVKTPLGYMFFNSQDDNKNIKQYMRGVNVSGINEEVSIDDVRDLDNVNILVRRKKK